MTPSERGPRVPRARQAKRVEPRLVLRLYVAGASPNSVDAQANLTALLTGAFAGRFELEIVDVLRHPGRAVADAVLVTPMLHKLSPAPACRIFGNLKDSALVLRTLGFPTVPA